MFAKSVAFVCAMGFLVVILAVAAPAQPPAPTPVDEAFANPTAESGVTPALAKKPPAPLDEMPPAEKPEGQVSWIGGYWHWDEDRKDYLWVSGCWRTTPP